MQRLNQLFQRMAADHISNFLITKPVNIYYLTGFTGEDSALLLHDQSATLITDSRYIAQAHRQLSNEISIFEQKRGLFTDLNQWIPKYGALAFESNFVLFHDFQNLKANLPETELIPLNGFIEVQREVKDAQEIELIQTACQIADDCFDHIIQFIKPGLTELAVANEMAYYMRSQGASDVSFETIVASGYRSAWPHGSASDKEIANNELITLDYGCFYKGYTSDITRTVALGTVDPELEKIYNIVLTANKAVLDMVKPGVTGAEIDAAARNIINDAGYGAQFGHGTGHSIGLEIHEGPGAFGSYKAQAQVVGNVETDEPGIYLEGKGGVRIEDDLFITPEGNQLLTHAPKENLLHI
ncbi:M24 family metallopeptidase [Agrilactobacillus fermenti]|uniref:M24 family metallopeptidase n=1 Tax=Agrilactobacillus fermenti TaxID=2586909 RepID=UPI001E42E527|nr:Xaa-Pro peptidase family protein [Agrilactobacillus fermenti]MCD2256204.1 aminopeptidase P family protein [Agrilactobacillus fermenti]